MMAGTRQSEKGWRERQGPNYVILCLNLYVFNIDFFVREECQVGILGFN